MTEIDSILKDAQSVAVSGHVRPTVSAQHLRYTTT